MIELTSLPTMDPVPRARVRVTGKPAGATTVTVRRTSRSGTVTVRRATAEAATDPFTVEDYSVPWNEDVTYEADFFDGDGMPAGSGGSGTVRVVFFGTVLHQPLDPARAVSVRALESSAETVTRSRIGELVRPGGGMPLWIGLGGSDLRTQLRMELTTDRDRVRAESMFGTPTAPLPPIICLRTSLPLHLPQPFVFVAQETPWTSLDHYAGGQSTELVWDAVETAEPALGLVVSPFSYEDIEGWYATYEDILADNASYEALEGRTDLAGVA